MKNLFSIIFTLFTIAGLFAQNDKIDIDEVGKHKRKHYHHHHPIHLDDDDEKVVLDIIDLDGVYYMQVFIKLHHSLGCIKSTDTSLYIRLENSDLISLTTQSDKCGKVEEHAFHGNHTYLLTYKLDEELIKKITASDFRTLEIVGGEHSLKHKVENAPYGLQDKLHTYFKDNLAMN